MEKKINVVMDEKSQYGVTDKDGNVIVPFGKYDFIAPFGGHDFSTNFLKNNKVTCARVKKGYWETSSELLFICTWTLHQFREMLGIKRIGIGGNDKGHFFNFETSDGEIRFGACSKKLDIHAVDKNRVVISVVQPANLTKSPFLLLYEGEMWVKKNKYGKWGVINDRGEELLPVEFDAIIDDFFGNFLVVNDGKMFFGV